MRPTPPIRALTDSELDRLDTLLAAAPEPLQPLDCVALDGYLCGVLVQPDLIDPASWLPAVFDADAAAGPLPPEVDPAWREEVGALVLRHHDALRAAIAEQGEFAPLLPAQPPEAPEEDPELPEASRLLWPWVAGFTLALERYPSLAELPGDEIGDALDRLWRHLPAASEYERDARDALARRLPLPTAEAAIDDLIAAVVELSDLTESMRYHVEPRRRDMPKVGRNDPCPCGSGRKFKHCHGV